MVTLEDVPVELNRSKLFCCFAIGLIATVISLSLSIFTGWQSGESLNEKLVLAGSGALIVLAAHLFLALGRSLTFKVQLMSFLLWLLCLAYVIFNHASFFMSSQQQAGMHRAALFDQSTSVSKPKRNLTEILTDQARVKTELVSKSQVHCYRSCETLNVKLTNLQATLEMLTAEADDVRKWQAFKERQDKLKETIRDDPAIAELAAWSGMTNIQMGLVRSLLFAVILEGVACFCWYLTFQLRDLSVTQKVTLQTSNTGESNADTNKVISPTALPDTQVEELVEEVLSGRLKLTVKDVRDHCRCAQKRAADLKRLIEVRLNDLRQVC